MEVIDQAQGVSQGLLVEGAGSRDLEVGEKWGRASGAEVLASAELSRHMAPSPRCEELWSRGAAGLAARSPAPPPFSAASPAPSQPATGVPLPVALHVRWAVCPSGTLTAPSRSSFSILGGTGRSKETGGYPTGLARLG